MRYRYATIDDATLLAHLNRQLIVDEGHRNTMSRGELEARLCGWLSDGTYEAVLFERDGTTVGYALFHQEVDHVYLRQFFVVAELRRQGIGRAALDWLRQHAWAGVPRIRVEVLVNNTVGIAFWRGVGFEDYCLTLEMSGLNLNK